MLEFRSKRFSGVALIDYANVIRLNGSNSDGETSLFAGRRKHISAVLQSPLSQCKCERTGVLPGGLSLSCLHSKNLHPGSSDLLKSLVAWLSHVKTKTSWSHHSWPGNSPSHNRPRPRLVLRLWFLFDVAVLPLFAACCLKAPWEVRVVRPFTLLDRARLAVRQSGQNRGFTTARDAQGPKLTVYHGLTLWTTPLLICKKNFSTSNSRRGRK